MKRQVHPQDSQRSKHGFSFNTAAWMLVVYTIFIILWGAWVRMSHSGDGCGASWPLCANQLVPTNVGSVKTWIEYFHRITSGIYGLAVVLVFAWAQLAFPKGGLMRKISYLLMCFMVLEALIGANLVLSGLVGSDESLARVVTSAAHLSNTLLLLAVITCMARTSRIDSPVIHFNFGPVQVYALLGIIGFLLLGISGSWASLSSTLFPSDSLEQGFRADISPSSHFLVRVRLLHPFLALVVGGFLVHVASLLRSRTNKKQKAILQFQLLVVAQLIFGTTTLVSLSPTWMKLSHLLLSCVTWVAYIELIVPIFVESSKASFSSLRKHAQASRPLSRQTLLNRT